MCFFAVSFCYELELNLTNFQEGSKSGEGSHDADLGSPKPTENTEGGGGADGRAEAGNADVEV